jgi:hypothetical protein
MLWNLPEELAHNVLSSWVGVDDVCRLDSAVCSKALRATFLRVIRLTGFVISSCYEPPMWKFHPSRVSELRDQFMVWIMSRDLAISEVAVTRSFVQDEYERISYLQRHGEKITAITCQERDLEACTNVYVERVLSGLCEYCANISTLDLGIVPSADTRLQETVGNSSWSCEFESTMICPITRKHLFFLRGRL